MAPRLRLRPYGDAGLLAAVLDPSLEARWSATQALAVALRADPPSWFVDLVATYDHLFVTFDPLVGDHAAVETLLQDLARGLADDEAPDGRTFDVPVLFGGDAGPDLSDVAAELGLSTDAVVDRLTAAPWRVRFVASPIGTPFTDTPDWDVTVPRMQVPRTAVPPGTIALSGGQSIIYPVRSPGGWRLVGRTPLRVLDTSDVDDLVPYRPGDRLRYVPVDAATYAGLAASGERLGAP